MAGHPEPAAPPADCHICPRLAAFRAENRARHPEWHNAPVASFGPLDARLLVVGLAPGLRGANRTGRPFTGDYAGVLLYETLAAGGFAEGIYAARPDDGLTLHDCRIVNAVRCVPPQNLPKPAEIAGCNRFLHAELAAMPQLRVILALGVVAHNAVLRACGVPLARRPFRHGTLAPLPAGPFRHGTLAPLPAGPVLADSYHVSRYNTSTRRLTPEMFRGVMQDIAAVLAREGPIR